jgi:hypothetical protein
VGFGLIFQRREAVPRLFILLSSPVQAYSKPRGENMADQLVWYHRSFRFAAVAFLLTLTLGQNLFAVETQPILMKGQWKYHSSVTVGSYSKQHDWTVCTTKDKGPLPSMIPTPKGRNFTCSKPTLTVVKKTYRTTQACKGQNFNVDQDITFTPENKGKSVVIEGQMIEELQIPSRPAQKIHMVFHATGQWLGPCP